MSEIISLTPLLTPHLRQLTLAYAKTYRLEMFPRRPPMGAKRAQDGPETAPRGHREGSKRASPRLVLKGFENELFHSLKMAPRRLQVGAKMALRGPTMAPRGPTKGRRKWHALQRPVLKINRAPQSPHDGPNMAPTWPQERPRWP